MVKAYKSSCTLDDDDLGMELTDTNMNMNFVVSQIDSIQRLTKSTESKQIKKKPCFKKVTLQKIEGEVTLKPFEPEVQSISNAYDSFMQECEQTPITRFSPENFLAEHAEKFQICENLDNKK
jgi:hypothetical protein